MTSLRPAILATTLPSWSLWAIGLVALAVIIGLRTIWSTRTTPLDLPALVGRLLPATWLLPALAMAVAVGIKAAPQLSPGPPLAPSWTAGSVTRINGDRRTSKASALASALEKATAQLKQDFQKNHRHAGHWELPVAVVKARGVQEIHDQDYTMTVNKMGSAGKLTKMYQYRVRLQPFHNNYSWLRTEWNRQTLGQRQRAVACVLGLCCVVLLTSHVYLRLDATSGGIHQGKLQIAAASLVTAAGLIGIGLLG